MKDVIILTQNYKKFKVLSLEKVLPHLEFYVSEETIMGNFLEEIAPHDLRITGLSKITTEKRTAKFVGFHVVTHEPIYMLTD